MPDNLICYYLCNNSMYQNSFDNVLPAQSIYALYTKFGEDWLKDEFEKVGFSEYRIFYRQE